MQMRREGSATQRSGNIARLTTWKVLTLRAVISILDSAAKTKMQLQLQLASHPFLVRYGYSEPIYSTRKHEFDRTANARRAPCKLQPRPTLGISAPAGQIGSLSDQRARKE